MDDIDKLLAIAEDALSDDQPSLPSDLFKESPERADELRTMLKKRNGFFAFARSLHVFPVGIPKAGYDLVSWNSLVLWRQAYGSLIEGGVFFAENLFGDQYAIRGEQIYWLDRETGEMEPFSNTLEEWANIILADPNTVGYSIALRWQSEHGAISPGMRLFPKVPFVTGGDASLDNLFAGDSVNGLNFGGEFANQIRNLPDGTHLRIQIID